MCIHVHTEVEDGVACSVQVPRDDPAEEGGAHACKGGSQGGHADEHQTCCN